MKPSTLVLLLVDCLFLATTLRMGMPFLLALAATGCLHGFGRIVVAGLRELRCGAWRLNAPENRGLARILGVSACIAVVTAISPIVGAAIMVPLVVIVLVGGRLLPFMPQSSKEYLSKKLSWFQ